MFGLSQLNIRNNDDGFTDFMETCMKILNQHAAGKQKHVQGNHLPLMNKTVKRNYNAHKAYQTELKRIKESIRNKETIVYKKTEEWYIERQRVTTSDKTSDNE